FRQIRWSEIDGDAACRQCEARRYQCGADTLLGFRNGLVRKSDDIESGQSGCDLHLYVDGARLDPFECDSSNSPDNATSYSEYSKKKYRKRDTETRIQNQSPHGLISAVWPMIMVQKKNRRIDNDGSMLRGLRHGCTWDFRIRRGPEAMETRGDRA